LKAAGFARRSRYIMGSALLARSACDQKGISLTDDIGALSHWTLRHIDRTCSSRGRRYACTQILECAGAPSAQGRRALRVLLHQCARRADDSRL